MQTTPIVPLKKRENPESYQIKNFAEYEALWKKLLENRNKFWTTTARRALDWHKDFTKVYSEKNGQAEWFADGMLNVSYNCLDRHLPCRANKKAFIWESEKGQTASLTYDELHKRVVAFASVLKSQGLKARDAVTIYLSMTPDLVVAMLACCRIGVMHNIVFAGFSAESLRSRIINSNSKLVITADAFYRKNKLIGLKKIVDEALSQKTHVEKVLVFNNNYEELTLKQERDFWIKDLLQNLQQMKNLNFSQENTLFFFSILLEAQELLKDFFIPQVVTY